MRRRKFITLLSGVAVWPLAARAQPAMPLVGFVNAGSARGLGRSQLEAYLKGLGETGYIEGPKCIDRIPLGREQK